MNDLSQPPLLPLEPTSWQPASRTCKACGKRKPLDQFPYQVQRGRRSYLRRCKDCRNAQRRSKWDELAPEEKRAIGHKVHGRPLTVEEFAAKVEAQGGACAICGEVPELHGGGRPRADGTRADNKSGLSYDHDHATGVGRDLLCHRCNVMIGMAYDDPARLEAAAVYVRYWAAQNAT